MSRACLLAQEAGDLGEVDQGALGPCGRHGGEVVAREGLGLAIGEAGLHLLLAPGQLLSQGPVAGLGPLHN